MFKKIIFAPNLNSKELIFCVFQQKLTCNFLNFVVITHTDTHMHTNTHTHKQVLNVPVLQKNKKKKKQAVKTVETGLAIRHLGALPKFTPQKGISVQLTQLWSQYKTEVLGIVKSVPFILLAFLGLQPGPS